MGKAEANIHRLMQAPSSAGLVRHSQADALTQSTVLHDSLGVPLQVGDEAHGCAGAPASMPPGAGYSAPYSVGVPGTPGQAGASQSPALGSSEAVEAALTRHMDVLQQHVSRLRQARQQYAAERAEAPPSAAGEQAAISSFDFIYKQGVHCNATAWRKIGVV